MPSRDKWSQLMKEQLRQDDLADMEWWERQEVKQEMERGRGDPDAHGYPGHDEEE